MSLASLRLLDKISQPSSSSIAVTLSVLLYLCYLDISQTFDKVDHGSLEHKLSQIGVCGKLGAWIHNFLQERLQYVRVPGGISDQ